MTPGTTGARSELLAAAELMRVGYDIFRCESPHAPFDLVAHRDGKLWRVEVKTITESQNAPAFPWPKNDQWDLLALVGSRGVLLFEPGHRDSIRNRVRAEYGHPALAAPGMQFCPECKTAFVAKYQGGYCSQRCRSRVIRQRRATEAAA